jgi:hypothetical protein
MYLYTMMRQDSYVILLSERDTQNLIDEFNRMASLEMTKQDEVALLYAFLVALSFKPQDEVGQFMKYVKEKIKYEWFSSIAEIYLTSNAPMTIFSSYNVPIGISSIII